MSMEATTQTACVTNDKDPDEIAQHSQSASCSLPPLKPVALCDRPNDSGYGSAVSGTPDQKTSESSSTKRGRFPVAVHEGLYISRAPMDSATHQRLEYVQKEITKLLPKVIRAVPGKQKSIAIRPAMLGKSPDHADAVPYMVVFCSGNVLPTVRDFFRESEVVSLCNAPDDDGTPSFRVLVTTQLRPRGATPDITVQCEDDNNYYDIRRTYCGMPIRVTDGERSCNATFGGMVKVTKAFGEFKLYGLTAGHVTRDFKDGSHESEIGLEDSESSDGVTEGDGDLPGPWMFLEQHVLGRVISPNRPVQYQNKPYLDWALFELDTYQPNQLAAHSLDFPGGEIYLSSAVDCSQRELRVAMISGSQGVKHGTLSMIRASVLLGPGESFTDAYTMSLDDSEVEYGDSGSWVVAESCLGVYGHVIADDVFGDAYVIPMPDILDDIRQFLGASSVGLPSAPDIIAKRWPGTPSHAFDRSSVMPCNSLEDMMYTRSFSLSSSISDLGFGLDELSAFCFGSAGKSPTFEALTLDSPPPDDDDDDDDDDNNNDLRCKAVAMSDFDPRDEKHKLRLTCGQIVWISHRHGKGWLVAENINTQESGLVPEKHVCFVRDMKLDDGASPQIEEGKGAEDKIAEHPMRRTTSHFNDSGYSSKSSSPTYTLVPKENPKRAGSFFGSLRDKFPK
ncbi:hypothetical protein N0V93_008502 [Gnomoniopsis smithogilvyi]|uniref:SH3 domain-containing protein n=1 Tax=Gnomoniopsis smithogilvyi TaxID=1191159 RepID=A0A9W8YN53_9PEZI|nr:hypothetical protein N0V93_008502 [Gnomoniopsis smithogilvyi]